MAAVHAVDARSTTCGRSSSSSPTHDLVGNVDPVQYTIRLLVPEGSLLLGHIDGLGPWDAARLTYPWTLTARRAPGALRRARRSRPATRRSRRSTTRCAPRSASRRSGSPTVAPAPRGSTSPGSAAPSPPSSSSAPSDHPLVSASVRPRRVSDAETGSGQAVRVRARTDVGRRGRAWRALPSTLMWGRSRSSHFGQPPVGVAEQLHRRGHEHEPDDRRVDDHRDREAEPDHLHRRLVARHERQEHRDHDQRGRRDDPRRLGQPDRDGLAVVRRTCRGTPRGSARAGTPRSPSTARTGSRTSSAGTNATIGIVSSSPIRPLPQPHWNTATITPYAAPIDSRFMIAALSGTRIERNTIISRMNAPSTTAPMHQQQPRVHAVGQVDELGGHAADVHLARERGALRPRRG